MFDNPVAGALYMFRGLGLITRPGIRPYVVVPLLINILLFGGGLWWGWGYFQGFLAWVNSFLPSWLEWLSVLLIPLFFSVALVIVFFTFTIVANLIAAPFNGLLAEKVETHLTGKKPAQGEGTFLTALADMVPAMLTEVGKILYYVAWAIPLLLLFLVPGVNLAAPVLWMLFSAWMMSVNYGDFAMGNNGMKGREIRAKLRSRRMLSLGFGFAVLLFTMIPVVNFFAMPAAVAGATALWVERLKG